MDRIVHLSDWHSIDVLFERRLDHECLSLPHDPDLVVITGDMIADNIKPSLLPIMGIELQRPHWERLIDVIEQRWEGVDIVAVRGNHDWLDLDLPPRVVELGKDRNSYRWKDHIISGFRGVPFINGTWNDEMSEGGLKRQCDLVDPETTILLTHCPPYGILDDVRDSPKNWRQMEGHPGPRRLGSHVVKRLHSRLHKLRAHCFGHIHEKGEKSYTSRGVRYSNAAETMNYFEL